MKEIIFEIIFWSMVVGWMVGSLIYVAFG